jgi:hypothetical protein
MIKKFDKFRKSFDFHQITNQIHHVDDIIESLLEDTNFYHKYEFIVEYGNQFTFLNVLSLDKLEDKFYAKTKVYAPSICKIILGIYIYERKKQQDYSTSEFKETVAIVKDRLESEDFLKLYNPFKLVEINPNKIPMFFRYLNTLSFLLI